MLYGYGRDWGDALLKFRKTVVSDFEPDDAFPVRIVHAAHRGILFFEQLEQAVHPVVRKAGFSQVKNLFLHHCGVRDCLPRGGLVGVDQPGHSKLGAAEIAHHNRQHI